MHSRIPYSAFYSRPLDRLSQHSSWARVVQLFMVHFSRLVEVDRDMMNRVIIVPFDSGMLYLGSGLLLECGRFDFDVLCIAGQLSEYKILEFALNPAVDRMFRKRGLTIPSHHHVDIVNHITTHFVSPGI